MWYWEVLVLLYHIDAHQSTQKHCNLLAWETVSLVQCTILILNFGMMTENQIYHHCCCYTLYEIKRLDARVKNYAHQSTLCSCHCWPSVAKFCQCIHHCLITWWQCLDFIMHLSSGCNQTRIIVFIYSSWQGPFNTYQWIARGTLVYFKKLDS